MTPWLGELVLETVLVTATGQLPGELNCWYETQMGVGRGTGAWGLWRLEGGFLVGMEGGEPRSPVGWRARGFSERRGEIDRDPLGER